MPNGITVEYRQYEGDRILTETDAFIWTNGHRYLHEIDDHGNLVICKYCTDSQVEVQHTHIKSYARGIWTTVFQEFDEHA
jgi:hypothetical protein